MTAHQPVPTFALDVAAIKLRARSNVDQGAITSSYALDRQNVISLLNDSLAAELICVLRYRNHHFMAAARGGIAGAAVKGELLQHANQELAHADLLAERITQLGGVPDFAPQRLTARSATEYAESDSLRGMLTEDLVAERIAVESYGALVRFVGHHDPTTRKLLEGILAEEEGHADELADFLKRMPIDG